RVEQLLLHIERSQLRWFGVVFYGEITTDFKPCIEFFYAETIPQGISGDYQALCQHYENQYHFATLYDRNRRIPLYHSAYILSPGDGPRPKNTNWMIEPRILSYYTTYNYQKHPDQNVKNSQAVNEDYKHSGYTRGHLAPSGHQQTEEDKEATFTLTNIVPQMEKFNNGPWSLQDEKMLERFNVCMPKMYVITGVMVTVPEYFWTAYCCPTFTAGPDQNYFPTYAAVGRNDPNNGYDVKEMSLEDLEKILQKWLKMPEMSLFKIKVK
uniref:Uncharacterized protein n=1 Tax=Pundamilia nyererei TaxID=303518 RepID=A0A3B4HCU4_9CICH